ncbi:MAG: trp operon repressor [Myxococcota bacterium]
MTLKEKGGLRLLKRGASLKGWDELVQLLAHVQDRQHMDELLRLLLTLHEQESLANRYRIVHALLCSGKPQRHIAKNLQVSIAKVTAGSNGLKQISASLKQLLHQHIDSQKQ